MTGDDRLRAELDALERSAPSALRTLAPQAGRRPVGRFLLVAATVVAAIAATSLAVDNIPPVESGGTTQSASAVARAVSDEDRSDDFSLTISSPQNLWQEGDSIPVQAVLRYVGDREAITVVSTCGPIVFSLEEVGGDGAMHPAICAAFVSHRIRADEPIVRNFAKSGIALGSIEAGFMEGSDLRLTPGTWKLTATFSYGSGDEPIGLKASIELEVVEAHWSDQASPSPSAAGSPTDRILCRDSSFDRIGNYVSNSEIEDDLILVEAALQDEPEFAGVYISDEKGFISGLEGVLLLTSCDALGSIPSNLAHPDRLRVELVEHSLAELTAIYEAISNAFVDRDPVATDIGQVALDVSRNQVRVSFIQGTASADIVAAGGTPGAFAARFGTDGISFDVIAELPVLAIPSLGPVEVVPGLPLSSASEIPRYVD